MTHERNLRRWARRLAAPAIVVQHGIVVAANAHAQRLWGGARSQLGGRPLHTLLHGLAGQPAPPPRQRARRRGPRGSTRLAQVCTASGQRLQVEVHTLVDRPGGELLLLLELGELRRRHADLMRRHAALQARAAAQVADHERHRRHVAELVHDRVQQSLAALQLELQAARHALGATLPAVALHLEHAQHQAAGALQATRHVVDELSPPVLSDLGLVAALEALVQRVEATTPLRVRRDWRGAEAVAALADRLRATVLYRATEACLWPIGREARLLDVCITMHVRGASGIVLEVEGDAAGLAAAADRLAVMGDWVRELHGELAVMPAAPGLARMSLHLDLAPEPLAPRFADGDAAALLGLFHRLPVGVVEMDAAGQVAWMNPAAARVLLPLAHPQPLDNLPTALQHALPGLQAAMQADAPATAPGTALRLPLQAPGIGRFSLCLHRQSGARWLAVVSEEPDGPGSR